jgi:esterase/lipase superfamily enzyme
VFVHGWRMTHWDYESFSQTMFKRLYWQGYQGKFASLRWPTRSADTDTNLLLGLIPEEKFTYNRSEHIAFKSGTGAALYFNHLRERFTNNTISLCAHSMGNITAMQALSRIHVVEKLPPNGD